MSIRLATLVIVASLASAPHAGAVPNATTGEGAGQTWTTFFDSGPLKGSGWASCSEPVGVSIDMSKFFPADVNRIDLALTKAVSLWSQQKQISFAFAGVIPVDYDTATGVIAPHDGVARKRHIYIAFVSDAESPQFSTSVVGLGEPTSVVQGNLEITQAEATFERDYVTSASVPELVALFAHEFGHALGLGHSANKADVMYPIVRTAKHLGPGDIAAMQSIARPCGVTIPSRDYPVAD